MTDIALATPAPTESPYALHGTIVADLGYSAIPCRPARRRTANWY